MVSALLRDWWKEQKLFGDKRVMASSQVGYIGSVEIWTSPECHLTVTELSTMLVPWLVLNDLDEWFHCISLHGALGALMSWCAQVEILSFFCLGLGGGRQVVGGFLLTDGESALEIWARDDGRGSFGARNLDADCPSPSYFSPGSHARSCDILAFFFFFLVTSYKESLPLGTWYIIIPLFQHITNKTR